MMALVFSSCRTDKKTPGDLRTGAVTIQGDKAKCSLDSSGGAINPQSPLLGTWDELNWLENEKIRFSSSIDFKGFPNSADLTISYTNICTIKSMLRSAVVGVSTVGTDYITSFSVNQPGSKVITEKFGSNEVTCDVQAEVAEHAYNFDGKCLVIDGRYYIRH